MLQTKANVLLVGATSSQATLIRETLASATGGPYALTHAGRVADGLTLLEDGTFDVVFIDTALGATTAPGPLASLVSAARGAGIVSLLDAASGTSETGGLKSAVHATLVKDPTWELDAPRMIRAIERALTGRRSSSTASAQPARRTQGSVLSFLGAKGGSCTSSVALRAAQLLASRGARTMLAELRSWPGALGRLSGVAVAGHLGQLLDVEPGRIDTRLLDLALSASGSHLKLLLAPPEDRGEPGPTADQTVRLLDCLTRVAERVVIDLPCEITPALEVVCQASSVLVLVVESDVAALRQGRRLCELLASWSGGTLPIGALVVHREGEPAASLATLRSALGCEVFAVLPAPAGAPPQSVGKDLAPVLDELIKRIGSRA